MMFSKSYKNSTALVATSSGGQLPKDYAMFWGQENLHQGIDDREKSAKFHFYVHSTVNSPSQEIQFLAEGYWRDIFKRLVGLTLVALMPEEGLDEVLTSLKDIYEFNVDNVRYRRLELPIMTMGVGTVSSLSESPDLIISD